MFTADYIAMPPLGSEISPRKPRYRYVRCVRDPQIVSPLADDAVHVVTFVTDHVEPYRWTEETVTRCGPGFSLTVKPVGRFHTWMDR